MKSFKDSVILLTLVFSALFLINTGLMYACFGVNAMNPVHREEATRRVAVVGGIPGNRAEAPDPGEDASAGDPTAGSAMGGSGEASAPSGGPGETGVLSAEADLYMTPEEVEYLSELSLQDKLSALTLLSGIGGPDSDRIYALASDGVTYAELEEIKSILAGKLSEADMQTLYGILDKSRRLYAERLAKK